MILRQNEISKIKAHENVLGFVSEYFRVMIRINRAKSSKSPIEISFEKYPLEIVKVSYAMH